MGHGHDDKPPYKVPHYSTFNDITGIKQLEDLQKTLAKKGLCDPWIRNEAWRYHPDFGTRASRALTFFGRGMPLGIVLGATVAIGNYLMSSLDDEHGSEDHGGGH